MIHAMGLIYSAAGIICWDEGLIYSLAGYNYRGVGLISSGVGLMNPDKRFICSGVVRMNPVAGLVCSGVGLMNPIEPIMNWERVQRPESSVQVAALGTTRSCEGGSQYWEVETGSDNAYGGEHQRARGSATVGAARANKWCHS
jgi:hypothetical protein